MDCNALNQVTQKLSQEAMMAHQFQQLNLNPSTTQHIDPLMQMDGFLPNSMESFPTGEIWAAEQQAQQHDMALSIARAKQMEAQFQSHVQQQGNEQGDYMQTLRQDSGMGTAIALGGVSGMMMNIPRTQFTSAFNTSQQQISAPLNTTENTDLQDNSWIDNLANQQWNQNYDDVAQLVQPGEELKSVEQKTKESEFYGFMDMIRDRRVLLDEENGKVVEGPGPEPEMEEDIEYLKSWAASEGLNMPDSVFQKTGPQLQQEFGLKSGVEAGVPLSNETNYDSPEEADIDALYNENPEEWAEHFAQINQNYEKYTNSTDYPFEKNNPYMFIEDPLQEGKDLLKLSNLAEAALAFEAVCQKENDHKEAWVLLGETQAENEKDYLAIVALNNARRIDPTDIKVHGTLAVCHSNESNTEAALQSLKQWLIHHPQYEALGSITVPPDPKLDVFEEYSSIDPTKLREIITLYTGALELNSNDADLHANLGVIYVLSQNFTEATRAFTAAAQLRPQDPALWNRIGASLANSGKPEEAITAYNRALDINPGYVRALYNMAVAQSNSGNHIAASKTLIRALGMQKGTTDPTRKDLSESQPLWTLLRMCFTQLERQDLVEMSYRENVEEFENIL